MASGGQLRALRDPPDKPRLEYKRGRTQRWAVRPAPGRGRETNVDIERRTFLKATALGGAVGLGLFDLSEARAELRTAKILRTTETRSICPYCAVACGANIHTLLRQAKHHTPALSYVDGCPDHPNNPATL